MPPIRMALAEVGIMRRGESSESKGGAVPSGQMFVSVILACTHGDRKSGSAVSADPDFRRQSIGKGSSFRIKIQIWSVRCGSLTSLH